MRCVRRRPAMPRSDRHWGRTALIAVLLILGPPTAGCSTEGPHGAPRRPITSDPADGNVTSTPTAAASALTAPAASGTASEACARAQQDAIRRSWMRVVRVIDAVTSSTDATSSAKQASAAADRFTLQVRAGCGTTPAAAHRYLGYLHGLDDRALDEDDLDRLLARYQSWGESVGKPHAATRLMRELAACRTLKQNVDASYRVWWMSIPEGRSWWVEVTVDNRTGRRLFTGIGGQIRVTGDRSYEQWWGGSSSDAFSVPPGVSTFRIPVEDGTVETPADGSLTVLANEVNIAGCAVPVPRAG